MQGKLNYMCLKESVYYSNYIFTVHGYSIPFQVIPMRVLLLVMDHMEGNYIAHVSHSSKKASEAPCHSRCGTTKFLPCSKFKGLGLKFCFPSPVKVTSLYE